MTTRCCRQRATARQGACVASPAALARLPHYAARRRRARRLLAALQRVRAHPPH